jgi:peroxiredoxin family protein
VSEALSIAVHAGEFDRVHYALVMASAAAASDRRVTLFFTGHAVAAVAAGGQDSTGGLTIGWHALEARPEDAVTRDAALRARGVAGFEELLAACRELGVRLIVCEMALRAAGFETQALRTDLALERAGVVTFLNQGTGGALMFV